MTERVTFVCQLEALTPHERARQKELTERLEHAVVGLVELDEGWVFQLTPDVETFAAAAEWMTYEGRCCPSLGFIIEWRNGEPINLRLSGEAGAKAFIADTFAPLTRRD